MLELNRARGRGWKSRRTPTSYTILIKKRGTLAGFNDQSDCRVERTKLVHPVREGGPPKGDA
jgi:hypothetical protein